MAGLGDLPGGSFESGALGVSGDGSIVVGYGRSALGLEAFRWTSGGGMVGLGHLAGGDKSFAIDASADGSVIVGYSENELERQAFRWTSSEGMVALKDYLIANGTAGLTGWTLIEAHGISANGRTMVGFGRNPDGIAEAWIATVPEPSTIGLAACAAVALLIVAGARRRAVVHG
jgi:probable HAF family extracellular repeat protein